MLETNDTASVTVTEGLRKLILSGEIAADTHLREKDLCERFEVSRTPVRDALLILATEGLLTFAPYKGYVTRGFTLTDVINAYELRAVLEGGACRIAAEHGLPRDGRAAAADALEEAEAMLSLPEWNEGDEGRWCELNLVLHSAMIGACGNPQLAEAIERTRALPVAHAGRFSWFVHEQLLPVFDHEARRRAHDDHTRIFSAVVAHDAPLAEQLMRAHIMTAANLLRRNWDAVMAGSRTQRPVAKRSTQAAKKAAAKSVRAPNRSAA